MSSYENPKPIINDIHGTVEDVAGSLTTTKTLMIGLIGDIEGMVDIARRQKEQPATISPDAIAGRLDALWALGDAIDQRIGENITLLYAVVENFNAMSDIAAAIGTDQPIMPISFREFVDKWFPPTAKDQVDFSTPIAAPTLKRHMDRLRWREALEACQRELAVCKDMNMAKSDDEAVSVQADKTADAYHALLALRAPTPADAQVKLLIMREWECGSPSDIAWNSIMDDMEALTAAA